MMGSMTSLRGLKATLYFQEELDPSQLTSSLTQLLSKPASRSQIRAKPLGALELDLTDHLLSLRVDESMDTPYGGAEILISMGFNEIQTKIKINNFRGLINFTPPTGYWVYISNDEGAVYFGVVKQVFTEDGYDGLGVRARLTRLVLGSFLSLPMLSQSRFTPISEINPSDAPILSDLLSRIHSSAITPLADYSQGFLKALKSSFKLTDNTPNALLLKKALQVLFHYPIPTALGGGTLGENMVVLDGGVRDMASIGEVGNEADVIRDYLVSRLRFFSQSVSTHMEILNSVFNPMPALIELFPFMRKLAEGVSPLNNFERATGFRIGFIYRYKPCTPKYAPTSTGYAEYKKSIGQPALFNRVSKTELFFGATINNTQAYEIEADKEATSIVASWEEDERVNAVFIENPFMNSDAQNATLIRSGAPLYCDVEDINRYGLRCFTGSNPLYFSKTSTQTRAQRYRLGIDAIPERVFHNVAMGHEYFRGSLTISHGDLPPLVGRWVYFSVGGEVYYAYVRGQSMSFLISEDGVPSVTTTLAISRARHGLHIPVPDNAVSGPSIDPKRMRALEAEVTKTITEWEL